MSELKVNKVSPRSGTSFTLGDSGDTFTVPSGATLTTTDATVNLPATQTVTTELKTNKISPASGTAFTFGDSGDTFTIPSGATIANSGTATGFGGNTDPFRNIIINGDMSLSQRATSTSGITGNGYHTIDRMFLGCSSAGTWTQSQSTDVPTGQGFANSLKMDNTTANGSLSAGSNCIVQQRIEGRNLQYLKKGTSSAESLTVSFWVYATKTGTNICELYDTDNTRQISQSYTISSSNTWEKKTLTFAGDTSGAFGNDNDGSLTLLFWLAAGSNFTSGTLNTSWASATNANRAVGQVNHADSTSNNWYITGIQLEVGTSATDFAFVPFDMNLQRCERYFEINEGGFFGPVYSTASDMRVSVPYRVQKRGNPTVTKISGEENCASSTTVTGNSLDQTLGARVQGTNVFATGASKFFNVKFSADAEL